MIIRPIAFFVTLLCLCIAVTAQNITTIAGNGYTGNVGDDGPATCAGTPNPNGICLDGKGFLYLSVSNSIRKVNLATNTISRVAGSDTEGSNGDGGPARDALLQYPTALCTDKKNNLYICETNGNRIRKINLVTGIISTYAGNGNVGYSGDGGPAIMASLNSPSGICTDAADNLYIADFSNNRIRKIDALTGTVTTIAGNGALFHSGDGGLAINASIPHPTSVAVDASGNIYFTEFAAGIGARIRKINNTTGIVTTIAGNNNYAYSGDGGLAINAEFLDPVAIIFDPSGNLYIADYEDSRVRFITASNGIINTIAGNGVGAFAGDGGPAPSSSLKNPLQLAHDGNGNLYIADDWNHRIRKVGSDISPPPVLPTTINISASSQTSCEGYPVTFTAVAVNPGFNAIYQWKVNGNPVNVIQPIFTTSILKNGDVVNCTLQAIVCGIGTQINTNGIKMTILPGTPSSVSIRASDTSVCSGTNVSFSAIVTNIASNPAYQWKRNGINVGSNSNSYATTALVNGDTVSCEVTGTSLSACGGTGVLNSNKIVMNVQSGTPSTISIGVSANDVCKGTPLTFTAAAINAGTNAAYQWILNGRNVGTNSSTYSSSSLSNNDILVCRLSSPGSGCSTIPVTSPELTVKIKSSPEITLFPRDTLVTAGALVRLTANVSGQYSTYTWSPANLLTSSNTLNPQTVALNTNTNYTLEVRGTEGCFSAATSVIRIFRKLFMPNAFTPNGDNINDVFRIPNGVSITLYEFSVFDRWGNKLFSTKDMSQGWSGTQKGSKSPNGVYTYIIRGADDKDKFTEKGTVTLAR